MDNIGHCEGCGQLKQLNQRNLCPFCNHDLDRNLNLITAYLKKNRNATLEQLSEETGLSLHMVKKYLMEGRILVSDYPNLQYSCFFCDEQIQKGYLCMSCSSQLMLEFRDLLQREGHESIEDYIRSTMKGRKLPELERYIVEGRSKRNSKAD